MLVHKIFPVSIFEFRLENFKEVNEKIEKYIYEQKKIDPEGITRSNSGGWHSRIFDLKNVGELLPLINFSKQCVTEVFNGYNWEFVPEKIKFIGMWSIINPPGSFNIKHTHPNSLLSAAYYVKAKKKSGPIAFFDPKHVSVMRHPKIKEFNELSAEHISFEPEEGKLFLFPAYLEHQVNKNRSDEDRIVISFNIDSN